ncbi:MAG TPA: cysteine desulfurase [Chromatiales bacterium]|nr:cysteine desulfurase [Chromatiales bacterium]HEX22198.1 cysteine desulfurase [Chromatiales bacterium]
MATYLDHNATTALDERVLQAMLPYLREEYGNPSSVHQPGRRARAALDMAREQVAALVNAHPSQVVFTSGGTEANNLALKGVAMRRAPGLLALSAAEHASVMGPAQALVRQGWQLEQVALDASGQLDADSLKSVLDSRPALLALMMANNETGVLFDIAGVAAVTREAGTVLLVDAVQAVGKLPVDFAASGAHLMSLSAHKIYGPKGVGALIVDKALDIEPLLHGGGQEKGRRAGTENVAAIAGFGKAAELALAELEQRRTHMRELQRHLEQRLRAEITKIVLFGVEAKRLPNTTYFAIPGIDGETLIVSLDQAGMAVASGSACGSGDVEPSHVLLAMGVDRGLASAAVRVSLGKDSRREEIDAFVDQLKAQVKTLQSFGSLACA